VLCACALCASRSREPYVRETQQENRGNQRAQKSESGKQGHEQYEQMRREEIKSNMRMRRRCKDDGTRPRVCWKRLSTDCNQHRPPKRKMPYHTAYKHTEQCAGLYKRQLPRGRHPGAAGTAASSSWPQAPTTPPRSVCVWLYIYIYI